MDVPQNLDFIHRAWLAVKVDPKQRLHRSRVGPSIQVPSLNMDGFELFQGTRKGVGRDELLDG